MVDSNSQKSLFSVFSISNYLKRIPSCDANLTREQQDGQQVGVQPFFLQKVFQAPVSGDMRTLASSPIASLRSTTENKHFRNQSFAQNEALA